MSAWWALAVLFASLIANAESTIVIRPLTQLTQGKAILLSDVAEFHEVDKDLVTQIGAIKLAEGPQAGDKIEFSGSAISAALRSHKVWSAMEVRPNVVIPSKIFVENLGQQISEAALRLEIIEKWQTQCGCRIELSEMSIPKIPRLTDAAKWHLRFPAAPAKGSFNMALELNNTMTNTQTLWLRGRVAHFKSAPVTKRQMQYGERIQPEDFEVEERDVTFARDAIPDVNYLVGRKVRQSVAANEILFIGNLEPEKALKRGDQVKMSVGEESWEVILMGVAEQDGVIGDTVKIRNPQSNQIVSAVVTGRGEVKIQ